MDRLAQTILAEHGLAEYPEPIALDRGSHCESAERARQELAQQLKRASADLSIMAATVEQTPEFEMVFDVFDKAFGNNVRGAAQALARFRELRDCDGEA